MNPVLCDSKPTISPGQIYDLFMDGFPCLEKKNNLLTYVELRTDLTGHMLPEETQQMAEKTARPVKMPSA